MTATSRVSFQMGCWPPARSMMLSRRMPSASPGARASPIRNPSSSGPRCSIAAAIARTRDSASLLREAKATPQIPHTLLFDLRRRKEGHTRAHGVLAEVEARNAQSAIRVPGQDSAQQQEQENRRDAQHQIEKGFSLEQQAPIDGFFPSRINRAQNFPQGKAYVWQAGQTDVRNMVVGIFAGILRDDADRLFKNYRMLQMFAR